MACLRYTAIFLATVVTALAGSAPRPKPGPGMLSGTHSLGMVMPQLSGWGPGGWNAPTTPPPETGWSVETTTGWPAPETTTPGWVEPETTTGWPAPETTTPGWVEPETTTGWPAPETTTGWPAPEVTTGWPAPTPGWSASPSTSIPANIEMEGESAVLGSGEAGATHGSQTSVSGDASNPAVAVINSGSYSSLGQGSGILQISSINSAGESNTFQGIDSYNFGDAGEYFGGSISGNQINTLNGGGSFVLGQGAIGQGGLTLNNNVPIPLPGWRQRR